MVSERNQFGTIAEFSQHGMVPTVDSFIIQYFPFNISSGNGCEHGLIQSEFTYTIEQ